MDSKKWIWKRKASEKNIEKGKSVELQRSLQDLSEQLLSVQAESNAKDDLLAKQANAVGEAIAGMHNAEAEALSLKKQLDDALLQKKNAVERVADRDLTLKECMQKLHGAKEDQQFIVNNAALKISREHEKIRTLEQRFVDTNKRMNELVTENENLHRILELKEQLLNEVNESKSKIEANFTDMMFKLDASEKLNSSLKYELCMLQKELEIRNEEREYNQRSSNAAHRQHLENVKKIAKLETECQRLRLMVRKRLPGPTALAKMRSEIEILGNCSIEARKKRSNSTIDDFSIKDVALEDSYDASNKANAALVGRLHATHDENKFLKESLAKKTSELQASRIMFARTASKLSQVEKQFEELSKGQACLEQPRGSPVSFDLPLSSISEYGGNDDSVSCAEPWASALISELEHFKSRKPTASSCRSAGVSELNLMDDFVEMEKLAVASADRHSTFGDSNSCVSTKESCAGLDSSYKSFENHPTWLQDILKVVIQKHHIMQKSMHSILDDVKVALGDWNFATEGKGSDSLYCDNNVLQQPNQFSSNSLERPNLEKPISRLIELAEGIIQKNMKLNGHLMSSADCERASMLHNPASANGYVARTFLWESSELAAVLQNLIAVCNDLFYGKVDMGKFTAQVVSTLDWIINHCFSLQDVSDMKETLRIHLDADESNMHPSKNLEKLDSQEESHISDERRVPLVPTSNSLYISSRKDTLESKLKVENEQLKYEMISLEQRKKELEEVLRTSREKNEALMTQLRESEAKVSSLQHELAELKESKGLIEDQIINQKLINEDLLAKLSVAKAELKEVHQKFSSLEVELEEKSNCCEDLEATCFELQLQIESASSKETAKYVLRQEEKQIQAECDVIAASEKLAACQETILNLGKQLKELASPKDAPLFDKVITSPVASAKSIRRIQLVDRLREEDQAKLNSPNTKEITCTEVPNPQADSASEIPNTLKTSVKTMIEPSPVKSYKGETDAGPLVIVPKKQRKGRFLRNLLLIRKREQ